MSIRNALAVAAVALSLAGAVRAEPAAPPAKPAEPGSTVSGITVQGLPLPKKSCSSRDQACVAMVVAELKARYPKELAKWCAHVEERAAMNELMFDVEDPNHPHPRVEPFLPPPVTKIACARDKK
jgi:hypothetical protein